MSTQSIKVDFLNALKEYTQSNNKKPDKVKISRYRACDFYKLTREDIGDLADEIMREGWPALNNKPFYGVMVEIVDGDFCDFRFE